MVDRAYYEMQHYSKVGGDDMMSLPASSKRLISAQMDTREGRETLHLPSYTPDKKGASCDSKWTAYCPDVGSLHAQDSILSNQPCHPRAGLACLILEKEKDVKKLK